MIFRLCPFIIIIIIYYYFGCVDQWLLNAIHASVPGRHQ